jgi:adenylate cyclase
VPRTATAEIERDALNAVNCARALAVTVSRLLPGKIGSTGTRARIGVHSGTAVAGTIGGSTRLKYTVVGDVVNVAARLQSVDLPDDGDVTAICRIVVSASTMALLDGRAPPAVDLGLLTLTGREQPVHAYRLQTDASPSP